MQNINGLFEFENVNGVTLSLKIDSRKGSPKSQQFTISYKNKKPKSSWPNVSLILAIFFNVLAFSYVKISFMAVSVIIIVFAFLVFFWITHSVQSEGLLVIPTVGMQNSVKYVFGREDNFIPWTSIDDIIINEVIKLNRVLYFLTVLVKVPSQTNDGEGIKVIPLFKCTKPRLAMLEKVYFELQGLLTEVQQEEIAKDFTERGSGDSKGSGDTG